MQMKIWRWLLAILMEGISLMISVRPVTLLQANRRGSFWDMNFRWHAGMILG